MENENACRERLQALSAYGDGELGQGERLHLEEHMDGCARCRQEVARFQNLTHLLREVDAEDLTSLTPVDLWGGISKELEAPARRGFGLALVQRWQGWAPTWARPVWVPVVVAGAVIITLALPFVQEESGLQADEAIVESVNEGEVMVFKGGKDSTIIWVFDD